MSRQIIAEERIKYPLQTAIQDGSLHTQPIDLVEIDPDRQWKMVRQAAYLGLV